MLVLALVLAALAALVHVYIFALESLLFDRPSTWRVFGVRGEDAPVLKAVFLNQGFYNLFLAVVTAAGIGYAAGGRHEVGIPLVVAGVGSMLAAAVVLITSNRALARPAVVQGALPALTLLTLLLR